MTLLPTVKDQKLRKWLMYGSLMSVLGLGSYSALDSMVGTAVKSQVNLDPNGQLYPNWIKTPIPLTYKFYVFHIENPDEILSGGKPRVSERGPYTFKQWRRKEVIKWAEDRSTVKYFEYKKYVFDSDNTIGSLDDRVTIINPMVATFGATVTKMTQEQLPMPLVLSPIVHGLVNLFFAAHRERLFTTQTVGELIKGRRIGMLDTITTLMKPLDWFGITLEEFPKEAIPPNNEFGLLAGRNDTPEGPYEVYTGLTDAGQPLQFATYKDHKRLKWWKADRCNMINGSDGSLFKPGLKPGDKVYAFAADICRSAALLYVRESEYMGIPSFRYEGDPTFMDAHSPENECFCMYKNTNKCKIDGLFDLSHCQFGAPLLLTTPHFIAFPELQQNIDGLTPNINDHITYVEVQPTLGAVLYGIKRIMFVIRVENNPGISAYKNIRNNFIPFVWAEESGGLNDELANQLLYSFVYPVRGASVATAGIGVAGIATIVTALGRKYYNRVPKTGADYGPNIYDKSESTEVKEANKSQVNE